MRRVIILQNDLIELLYSAEKQVLPYAAVHGFGFDPAMIVKADNLRKEIADLKTELV